MALEIRFIKNIDAITIFETPETSLTDFIISSVIGQNENCWHEDLLKIIS